MKERYIEILSPAGSFHSITAAVNCGCNAVYLGGKSFNARQYADNFTDEDLKNIIKYCHLRMVKVFITVNTIYKNPEFPDLLKFICKLYEYGADALIIQDIGLFSVLHKHLPDFPLHASTQLTTHNAESALFLKKMGFRRIVLSRELSLEEIKEICRISQIEIECFVHGALCVSYSGRCLMSSVIGGRSGNRGRCAQPCRMMYSLAENGKIIKKGFLLSTKDILTVNIMDKLIDAGITSFKIEGRMKSPEYVAQSTLMYRKYADMAVNNNFKTNEDDKKELLQIFNRGGSSSQGYYDNWGGSSMLSLSPKSSGIKIGKVVKYNYKTKKCTIFTEYDLVGGDGIEIWTENSPHTGTNISKTVSANSEFTVIIDGKISKGDLVYRSYDKRLNDNLKKLYNKNTRKQKIKFSLNAFLNMPLTITMISENGTVVTYSEEIVEKAENQPLSTDTIIKQLSKTGNTPFEFIPDKIQTENNIYITVSALNNFRRNACEQLETKLSEGRKKVKINCTIPKAIPAETTLLSASVLSKEQFDKVKNSNISRIYIPFTPEFIDDIKYYTSFGNEIYLSVPSIVRQNYREKFDILFEKAENSDIAGYLYKNYDLPKTNKKIALDQTFNVINGYSAEYLKRFADTVTLSMESSISELSETAGKGTEIIVYGRPVLMTTHQCPIGIHAAGKKKGQFCKMRKNHGSYTLIDRTKAEFPIIADCNTCTAFILGDKALFTADKFGILKNMHPSFFRLDFTTENADTTDKIISVYENAFFKNKPISKETVNLLTLENKFMGFPKGVL